MGVEVGMFPQRSQKLRREVWGVSLASPSMGTKLQLPVRQGSRWEQEVEN